MRNTRERLRDAFKELRQQDIIARMNFLCCQSCGCYELAEQCEDKNKRGYVFWHHQDEEHAQETGEYWIAFGGADGTLTPPEKGDSTENIAKDLIVALVRNGLKIKWSGSVDTRVKVFGYLTEVN